MDDTGANAIETVACLDDLPELIVRAQEGDASALPALRRALDDNQALWRRCGDLAAVAQQAWIELASGANLLARESLTRTLRALEAEVAGPAPTPLERLLAARVAACWLQVHYADALAAPAGGTVPQAKLAMERQGRAHRRYLQAVAALAAVRRLLRPLEARPVAGLPAREDAVVDADEGPAGPEGVERGRPAATGEEAAADTAAAGPRGLVLPIGPATTGAAQESGRSRDRRRRARP